MVDATKEITFGILVRKLFGDDVSEKFGTVELEDVDTLEKKQYNFFETWTKFVNDSLRVLGDKKTMLFPSFIQLGIG